MDAARSAYGRIGRAAGRPARVHQGRGGGCGRIRRPGEADGRPDGVLSCPRVTGTDTATTTITTTRTCRRTSPSGCGRWSPSSWRRGWWTRRRWTRSSTRTRTGSARGTEPRWSRKAWVDPAYRERLLADGTAAIGELGHLGGQGEHMKVVANTPEVHNLVVCTLCSCYPWPTLGLPARVVQVRPLPGAGGDRTARRAERVRPRRARGCRDPRLGQHRGDPLSRAPRAARRHRGHERREELAGIVSRDSMIGVARVEAPSGGPSGGDQ